MKTANKAKTEKTPSQAKTARGTRRSGAKTPASNGKHRHPPTTYEHAPIGIVEASLEGIHINVNEEFCRIVGYSKEELLGRPLKDFTHEDDYPIDVKLHEQLVAGKIPFYRFEKRYLRRDGGDVWVELTRSIVRDEKGTPLYTIGVVLDISERKHVERVLHESRERLRLATEAAQMFTWEWDFQNQSYTLSDSVTQVLGFSTNLLSQNKFDTLDKFVPAEDLSAVAEAFNQAVGNQKDLHTLQCRVINPATGQTVWLEISAKIVYDYDGQPQRMFGVAQNITEEKQKEEALSESEERFRALISQATAGIAQTDLNSRFTFVNPRFCEMLGYSESEILGKTIWEMTYTEDVEENKRLFRRLLEHGESYQFEKRFLRQDGSRLWTSVSVSTIRDLAGRPKGGVGVILDIDERKQAETALTEYARQQAALYQLADQLHRTSSLEDVFNAALDAILSALQCDRASILLYDHTDVMRFVSWRGLSENYRKSTDGHSPWKPDERNPEPISISEVHTSDLSDSFKKVIQAEGIGSLAFIPLVSNGKLIGKFTVYFNTLHRFDGGEIDLGLTIARQLAFGIERIRAEEALRGNEHMFSTLVDAAPFGVYFIDSEFRLLAINKGSEAVFSGISPLIGRDFAEILHLIWKEPFATEAVERFRHTLRTGESFISPPVVEERANIDEIQAYDWQIHRITLADGSYGVVCYFYDLSEQKKMESSVRASETLYRTIARSIPGGGVYVVDKNFRYLIAEGPVTGAFGLSREMLEGHTVSEVFSDERGARMEERLRRSFAGETVSFETAFNGRVYWTQQAPLQDSIGQAIILTLDITERKRAEEALRESEERFSAILRQATAGIVRKDANGRLVFVNQAFCNMLGYTEAELLGKTMWDLMHEEDIAENKRSYKRLMAEGIPFKLERRLIREDGSVIWVDASVSPIMDATGKPQSAVAVEVDISGRKQAEEALRELNLQLEDRVLSRTAKLRSVNQTLREEIAERQRIEEALRRSESLARANEEKLRTLFDLLPVGISFLDPQGQIIQMNSALPAILKLSKEELLQQSYGSRKYIRADGKPMSPSQFASARALAESRTVYNVETGILLENGEIIWTNVSAAPVDVADVGVVVVTVDVTDSKRAERALQESHRRLRILSQRLVEVQEEERRALARELHDRVGQTLAALNINLIIISGQLSGDTAELIGTRLNDSMKLVAETIALVRDVMTDLRPSVLDDYGLEAALESHIAQFMLRYNIPAKLEKPPQALPRLGPSIEMTFLRIGQEALMNIARHSRATEVHLSLRKEQEMICLTIQDNGIGIESWQEANRPGSHGLTIMRERAEAFGGTLRVKSVPGQGTMVEVNIPYNGDVQMESREKKNA